MLRIGAVVLVFHAASAPVFGQPIVSDTPPALMQAGADTERLLRRALSTGWDAGLVSDLADNVAQAARVFGGDAVLRMDFEAHGGEDAFIESAVFGRYWERELQLLGYDGRVPRHSTEDIQEAIAILRAGGWPAHLTNASSAMRRAAYTVAFDGDVRDIGEVNEECTSDDCRRALREAEIGSKIAGVVCLFNLGGPVCVIATGVALYAWIYAESECERCQ